MTELNKYTEDNVGLLVISDKNSKNYITADTLEKISVFIDDFEKDKNTDIIWIKSGCKNIFSAGYDIGSFDTMNEAQAKILSKKGSELICKIKDAKKIICCSIDGDALGGGFEIALACDLIFATKNSRFGFPEVNYGVLPGFGGTQLLTRKLYETFVKYLIFTGNTVSSEVLYEKSIINDIFYNSVEMENAVRDMCKTIKTRSKFALGLAKETINNGLQMPLEQALKYEQNAFMASFASNDKKEGMTAFKEKKEPVFTDRWEDFEAL